MKIRPLTLEFPLSGKAEEKPIMEQSEPQTHYPRLLGMCVLDADFFFFLHFRKYYVKCPKTCVTLPVESGQHTVIKTH